MKISLMMNYIIFPLFFLLLFCDNGKKNEHTKIYDAANHMNNNTLNFKYDLKNPIKKITLPKSLVEISGLTYKSENLLLAVQDESADIYTIDIQKEEVIEHFVSNQPADIEGIELVDKDVYLLTSEGIIIEHRNFNTKDHVINKYKTPFSRKNDTEGFCYDNANNTLLIACKQKPELKNSVIKLEKQRCIYQFDLKIKQLIEKPFLCIDLITLRKSFSADNFMPSAIAIHPLDGNIYVVSSAGKYLLIINRKGEIVKFIKLDEKIFRQPEGICFSPDGKSLFISNEGRGKKGNILQFESR